ncbi:hypothetical protein ACC731_37700, partial [Rhizobium ruizarguesonis]
TTVHAPAPAGLEPCATSSVSSLAGVKISAKDLREGLEVLTAQLNWPQISGHITTYSSKTGKIETVPVTRFDFVPSTPWSIANYRLIA